MRQAHRPPFDPDLATGIDARTCGVADPRVVAARHGLASGSNPPDVEPRIEGDERSGGRFQPCPLNVGLALPS